MRRTLALRKETLSALTPEDLTRVVGAAAATGSATECLTRITQETKDITDQITNTITGSACGS